MIPKPRKRKQKKQHYSHNARDDSEPAHSAQIDPALFIQAHEADLVRGPQAVAAAQSLEVSYAAESGKWKLQIGDGLIRWKGDQDADGIPDASADEHVHLGRVESAQKVDVRQEDGIWVDRYDARLLLDALPTVSLVPRAPAGRSSSPGGWSDLPSDAEDTFFFSPSEVEDYRREKRRRLIDQNREARLRALRAEADGDSDDADAQEAWGGSDEEPDDAQRELMRRTAAHILASPNPSQLEMRILANHGADGRFAFLRGRWARAWRIAKGRARVDRENEKATQEKEKATAKERAGLGGLAGYGDSDSDEDGSQGGDGEHEGGEVEIISQTSEEPAPEKPPVADDDAIKQARRARARMWAERRREMKPEMAEESPGQ